MKNYSNAINFFILLLLLSSYNLIAQSGSQWNKKNASKWFEKQEWLTGEKGTQAGVKYDQFGRIIETSSSDSNASRASNLNQRQLKPHNSIDKVEFAKEYHAHKLWWDQAFAYMKNTDLASLKPGDHPIVGEDVYARITEGPLKNIDSTKWEAHKNFIDIHYVITGREKIGIGPLSSASIAVPYNSTRDLSFYVGKGKYYTAEPGTFFLAFPKHIHRPGLEVDGKGTEKKLVVKIRSMNSN
jgi:YhcH/YjgK/YiaL family protein